MLLLHQTQVGAVPARQHDDELGPVLVGRLLRPRRRWESKGDERDPMAEDGRHEAGTRGGVALRSKEAWRRPRGHGNRYGLSSIAHTPER